MNPFSASVGDGLALAHVRRESVAAEAVEQIRHFARQISCASVKVFIRTLRPDRERDTDIENRGCMALLPTRTRRTFR
jgi:hypothetical protein